LGLIHERGISSFEGLENILPNLRILVSSAPVNKHEKDENLLNSFLYLVRNFPKLEEIRFRDLYSKSKISRLLKKEKPSLNIYYTGSCQYEPEPEKEGTRRNRKDSDEEESSESSPQKRKQTAKKQTKRTTTNTKKPAAKKAAPKQKTAATKTKQKAKVDKKKPAGKKTATTPKKKKIAPTTKKAGQKKKNN
jgi:hypothetical protein